ncbi:fasciclin domain-containing protein [Micromonospora sp. M71_S20]|uniref:fasciclin domain-containing protein n=1 Tax=Micromonospora sp. M71_S20 TaxID=592872 RepID=UPI000EB5D104|nr:fasciclin domain-containing protein [Micromonospora sp. M71_S20]RLK25091.1 fasciclin domain-containing protein [Micromonospora sp. M71_S20]
MSETLIPGPASRATCRRRAVAGTALALLVTVTGCTGSPVRSAAAEGTGDSTPVAVTGPLCDVLPSGTEPGSPGSLVDRSPAQALTWIPVLTTFEAAVRATGMAEELSAAGGLTILAPTDDAFRAKFSTANVDQLLLKDTATLRGLLREHLVAGARPVADLASAGTVTTLAGTTLAVTPAGSGARLADRAETVCADYRATGARIHVIDKVLGGLPDTAHEEEHHH